MATRVKTFVLALLVALPASVYGADPIFRHKDKLVEQEFEQVYQELRSKRGDPISRTKAQLNALSPVKAGIVYYCSDCATDGIVVSTGTGVGAVARISARTTVIN